METVIGEVFSKRIYGYCIQENTGCIPYLWVTRLLLALEGTYFCKPTQVLQFTAIGQHYVCVGLFYVFFYCVM